MGKIKPEEERKLNSGRDSQSQEKSSIYCLWACFNIAFIDLQVGFDLIPEIDYLEN